MKSVYYYEILEPHLHYPTLVWVQKSHLNKRPLLCKRSFLLCKGNACGLCIF